MTMTSPPEAVQATHLAGLGGLALAGPVGGRARLCPWARSTRALRAADRRAPGQEAVRPSLARVSDASPDYGHLTGRVTDALLPGGDHIVDRAELRVDHRHPCRLDHRVDVGGEKRLGCCLGLPELRDGHSPVH